MKHIMVNSQRLQHLQTYKNNVQWENNIDNDILSELENNQKDTSDSQSRQLIMTKRKVVNKTRGTKHMRGNNIKGIFWKHMRMRKFITQNWWWDAICQIIRTVAHKTSKVNFTYQENSSCIKKMMILTFRHAILLCCGIWRQLD